jgi:hypothetical protein
MSVPKCLKCKDLHQYDIGKYTYYDCYNEKVYGTGKKIYAKDIKTSPKWCPKRKDEFTEEERQHLDNLMQATVSKLFYNYK